MTMLRTHLQPIVAYFWNSNRPTTSQRNSTSEHSPLVLDYLADRPESTPSNNFLNRLWQSLFEVNTDPKVEERVDRHGQRYWDVYDPITQQHNRFAEEESVYEWLEHRYYQDSSMVNDAYAIERGYWR